MNKLYFDRFNQNSGYRNWISSYLS